MASVVCDVKKYSYQHIQGVMLVNLNKLAYELELTHTEYRVIAVLISLWNINTNMAYPALNELSKQCCMGKATVVKCLNSLIDKKILLATRTPGKRNQYYFSKLIMDVNRSSVTEPIRCSTCKTSHDRKLMKIRTNQNTILSNVTVK